jgi:hypothetical protein
MTLYEDKIQASVGRILQAPNPTHLVSSTVCMYE